jgi:hypothetical protein
MHNRSSLQQWRPISAIFAAAAAADKPPRQEVRSLPRSDAAADRAPAAPTKEVRQPPSVAADMAAQTPLQEVSMSIPELVRRLLAKYPSIIRSETLTPTPTHGVEHVINTGGNRPVFAKARRLAPDKLRIAEAAFKKLEAAGIIRRCNSAWASPLHMVTKKDESWRPCGDYRRLNTVTTPDRYPLPNMQDLANGLDGCTVFSKIDLVKGYHPHPPAHPGNNRLSPPQDTKQLQRYLGMVNFYAVSHQVLQRSWSPSQRNSKVVRKLYSGPPPWTPLSTKANRY